MATEAQILANQQNSRLSTGPRTEEGKARSRLNGVKHGLRADLSIMPWETTESFLAFQNNLMYSLQPNDPLQNFIAELAILTAWRLKRAARLEMAYFCRRLQPAASSAEAAPPQAEACGYTEGAAAPPQAEACGYTEEAASPPLGDPEPWEDAAILEEMKTFVESTRTSPLPRYEAHLNRQLNSYLAQLRLLKKDKAQPESVPDKPVPPPPIWEPEPINVYKDFLPPLEGMSEEMRKFEAKMMQEEHEHRLRSLADDAAALREHVAAEKEQREFRDENYEKGFVGNCQLLRIATGLEKQNR